MITFNQDIHHTFAPYLLAKQSGNLEKYHSYSMKMIKNEVSGLLKKSPKQTYSIALSAESQILSDLTFYFTLVNPSFSSIPPKIEPFRLFMKSSKGINFTIGDMELSDPWVKQNSFEDKINKFQVNYDIKVQTEKITIGSLVTSVGKPHMITKEEGIKTLQGYKDYTG